MFRKYDSRIVIFTTCLLALAGKIVGTPTVPSNDLQTVCQATCNLRQGFCDPIGHCTCHEGWEGANCDQCTLALGCIHGTCNQPWQCNCKEGYTGRHCQLDLQFCERHQPCSEGATCINDGTGSYACLCPPGYMGLHCNLPERPRIPSLSKGPSCLNGGTCIMGKSVVGCENCECPKGFAGEICETRIRMCRARPCANGGRCIDLLGDFRCQCTAGFVGKFCTEDVNECSILGETACKNGGICLNRRGSYRCSCPNGFEGSRCDKPTQRFTTTRSTTIVSSTSTTTSTESLISKLKDSGNNILSHDTKEASNFETEKSKDFSSHVQVTHIVREVKSSSSDSFVKQVVDGNNFMRPPSSQSDEPSVAAVQAVTFAFFGVAVVLFAGIGVFAWLYCRKKEKKNNCFPKVLKVESENGSSDVRMSNRNSLLLDQDIDHERKRQSIVKKGFISNPIPSVHTISSPSGSRIVREKSVPCIDYLYVALPQDSSNIRTSLTVDDEAKFSFDSSKLSQSRNSFCHNN